MIFNEIPAGESFYFGKTKGRRWTGHRYELVEVPMKWKKTQDNGFSILKEDPMAMSFDYKRSATGPNQYMRVHGHRLFTESSLCKFLNSKDDTWSSVEAGDQRPYNYDKSGFLSNFTQEEREFIVPHVVTVTVPHGMTKKYGQEVSKQVLVSIPSSAQIGTSNTNGGSFGLSSSDRINGWVTDADTMSMSKRYYGLFKIGSDHVDNVFPVIKLSGEAPVDIYSDGIFIIRIPEEDFDGNLAEFLGFEAAA